ncbi:MAG: DNA-protecting protein DprA, partial [Elusimicrobia bacterium]|nr:DNA-protecting protein DprA [Elusimicrobiota bacterium]
LITARRGLEQGREVFAVPGPADSPLSEGPNRLIADGAAPACDLRGIVDALPPLKAARVLNSPAVNLGEVDVQEPTAEGKKVLQWIGFESMPLEELLRFSGWSVQHLTEVLSSLELDGSVVAQPGQCYARKI